eukprot:GEMP01016571.1.p1 GENE.GEMP01016571.1~~GEMP01016571.1.p1  ORF type:complete len:544 (+),score=127.53 GEMP01016571.1:315-1946(+)
MDADPDAPTNPAQDNAPIPDVKHAHRHSHTPTMRRRFRRSSASNSCDRCDEDISVSDGIPHARRTMHASRIGPNGVGAHVNETLARSCRALLNKLCPENFLAIVPQIAQLPIHSARDLSIVCCLIFHHAITNAHLLPTYADMLFFVQHRIPIVPPSSGMGEGTTGRCMKDGGSIVRGMLQACEYEFARLMSGENSTDGTADEETQMRRRKEHFVGFMKLLGELYVRALVSRTTIGAVRADLLRCSSSSLPPAMFVECATVLARYLGSAYEEDVGRDFFDAVLTNLNDILAVGAYPRRLHFLMMDLRDLRDNCWKHKVFAHNGGTAMTKEEEVALTKDYAMWRVAGARPSYMCNEDMFAEQVTECVSDGNLTAASAAAALAEAIARLPEARQQRILACITSRTAPGNSFEHCAREEFEEFCSNIEHVVSGATNLLLEGGSQRWPAAEMPYLCSGIATWADSHEADARCTFLGPLASESARPPVTKPRRATVVNFAVADSTTSDGSRSAEAWIQAFAAAHQSKSGTDGTSSPPLLRSGARETYLL